MWCQISFNFLVMLGRTKRQSSDLFPESHKRGTNAHAQSLSLMLLSVASQTLGWSRPQLEPGHAIRVSIVSSGPLQIGPCVVLGSGAWHLVFLPITTHCRRTANKPRHPQKTTRMLMPSGVLCCFGQQAKNCALASSAVIIGSHAPNLRP